jgi:DNA-binding NarL/FixJ family response regulator
VVVDYHLGDVGDGLTLVGPVKRQWPVPRVLVYSAFADGALAALALIAGADGLLGKHELGDELCEAIRDLARGRHHLPAIPSAVAQATEARLEPGDQAIFRMLLHGLDPAMIAARLSMTHEQLGMRRSNMLRSLKPPREQLTRPPRRSTPLDYDRPKRRFRRSAG